jgi:uncharacterized protein with HEPN domain
VRNGRQLCQDILDSAKQVIDYAEPSFAEYADFLAEPGETMAPFQEGRMAIRRTRQAHDFARNGVADAVLYRLCVIGEATGDLQDYNSPQIFQAGFDNIMPTLSGFRRMRDLLIHQHWKVDLEIVWNTVETDVPALHRRVALLYPHFAK